MHLDQIKFTQSHPWTFAATQHNYLTVVLVIVCSVTKTRKCPPRLFGFFYVVNHYAYRRYFFLCLIKYIHQKSHTIWTATMTSPPNCDITDIVAHSQHAPYGPLLRPKYACCRNLNEVVALFCGVNARRHLLQAEPSPCGGTIFKAKAL